MNPVQVHAQFDPVTSTLTYVLWDSLTRDAVVIDPVLDFDPATQLVGTTSLWRLEKFLLAQGLRVHWVLDTHAHADHLSSSREVKACGLAQAWATSEKMNDVFTTFAKVLAWPKSLQLSGLGVDRFLKDGEEFRAGSLTLQAIATPGHTPACTTFRIGEMLFAGDALFMPDGGVGRCDFPGGSANQLYDSVWGKVYAFPDHYRIYVGHDYQPGGRPLRFQSSVGEQKASNTHLNAGTARADFIRFREARDKTLAAPRLLNPSLDWNLGAHQLVKRPKSLNFVANQSRS